MFEVSTKCQEEEIYFPQLSNRNNVDELEIKSYSITLDFGAVCVGKKYQKIFGIKSESKVNM